MTRVPPWLTAPGLQDQQSEQGPFTYVYDEGQLIEALSDATRDTENIQGDQGTFDLAFVAHTIILAAAFRFTAPCVIPAGSVGVEVVALPGLRFDCEDGLTSIFDVRGLLARIRNVFLFNEGLRTADAFVSNSLGGSDVWVEGNYVTTCKRLIHTTGTGGSGITRWRVLDNFCNLTVGDEDDATVDLADADDCLIQRNSLGSLNEAIAVRAGGRNDITSNDVGLGSIITSAGDGENIIACNRRTATITAHADDAVGLNT